MRFLNPFHREAPPIMVLFWFGVLANCVPLGLWLTR